LMTALIDILRLGKRKIALVCNSRSLSESLKVLILSIER